MEGAALDEIDDLFTVEPSRLVDLAQFERDLGRRARDRVAPIQVKDRGHVALEPHDGRWAARLTGDQGSGILRSMVQADGLAVLAGDTTVAKGEAVEVIVMRELSR